MKTRVLSVDIFRGLTMLVMIFVNDVASVRGLPWWTYHIPPGQNGMTYVDMVFPAFLFIVGMSIPLAVRSRLERGYSLPRLWAHIFERSLGLIVLGIFLANAGKLEPRLAGISREVWAVGGLVAAILFWNVYPKSGGPQTLYKALKYTGLAALVFLFAIFRRSTPGGQAAWLDFSYWEILGLIGKTYLAVCLVYVPLRNKLWAPPALLAFFTALNVASRMGWLGFVHAMPGWLWPFGAGELPSITVAGIVASQIFLDKTFADTFPRKSLWAISYAALLFAAGLALTPFGISKIGGTPTWCLYCSASSVVMFLVLYWAADVKRWTAWAGFVKPAGSNTLLTYLLPDVFYYAFGLYYFSGIAGAGWPGVVRSLAFTAFILAAAALLTRLRLRMQL